MNNNPTGNHYGSVFINRYIQLDSADQGGASTPLQCEIQYPASNFVCTANAGSTFLFEDANRIYLNPPFNALLGLGNGFDEYTFNPPGIVYISAHCPSN
jgi:hypothetical protein